jgi:predicted ATPase/Tfp pilus assembly protein PilF
MTIQPTYHLLLPQQATPLIDREKELDKLHEILEGKSRLLTLIGIGGIGKTRLALELGNQCKERYKHGVGFVSLEAVSSPDYLVTKIADALQFSFYSNGQEEQDLRVELLDFLREKELLLILDNFEHLLPDTDLVADILQAAPDVQILVTSQERLGLLEEWVFELHGLPCPVGELQNLESYESVQLFNQRAHQVNAELDLTSEELPHVAQICRLVGGLPLGLELASSWTRVLSCKEIAQEIEKDLDFLKGASTRNLPERHRSLRAVFERSWQLLNDEEREVLRKLTVFRGGFRVSAATNVAGAPLRLLLTLTDKSLLQRVDQERFAVPKVLRNYARQKFEADLDAGEKESIYARHCDYYCRALEEREGDLWNDNQADTLASISIDLENVRQAWQWAISQGDIESLSRSLETVYRYYQTRSLFQEGERLLSQVVAMASEQAEGRLLLGRTLSRQGRLLLRMARLEESKAVLEEGVTILEALGAQDDLSSSLSVLAVIAEAEGEQEKAIALQERSLEIFQEVDNKRGVATAHLRLGNVSYGQGNYEEARKGYQKSQLLFRDLGDQRGMAMCLNNLGSIADTLGEYREARWLYRESLAIKWDLGDHRGVAYTLNNLGFVSYLVGDYDLAETKLTESLAIFRDIGDRRGAAFALTNLGNVAFGREDYDTAETYFQESLDICREIDYGIGSAYALNHLGNVYQQTDQTAKAYSHHLEALEVAEASRATPVILEILVDGARLLAKDGQADIACRILRMVEAHPSARHSVKENAANLLAVQAVDFESDELADLTLEEAMAEMMEGV